MVWYHASWCVCVCVCVYVCMYVVCGGVTAATGTITTKVKSSQVKSSQVNSSQPRPREPAVQHRPPRDIHTRGVRPRHRRQHIAHVRPASSYTPHILRFLCLSLCDATHGKVRQHRESLVVGEGLHSHVTRILQGAHAVEFCAATHE